MKTEDEQNLFLRGYAKHGQCSLSNIRFYMAQIYVRFMNAFDEDQEYCDYVRAWLLENCKP